MVECSGWLREFAYSQFSKLIPSKILGYKFVFWAWKKLQNSYHIIKQKFGMLHKGGGKFTDVVFSANDLFIDYCILLKQIWGPTIKVNIKKGFTYEKYWGNVGIFLFSFLFNFCTPFTAFAYFMSPFFHYMVHSLFSNSVTRTHSPAHPYQLFISSTASECSLHIVSLRIWPFHYQ